MTLQVADAVRVAAEPLELRSWCSWIPVRLASLAATYEKNGHQARATESEP